MIFFCLFFCIPSFNYCYPYSIKFIKHLSQNLSQFQFLYNKNPYKMLSESQIQLKAQQYLQHFQQSHLKKQQLLKQLEAKVNNAAKIIQRAWKKYSLFKQNYYAFKIQKAWKSYRLRLISHRQKINSFRRTFFAGKIAYFIQRKYSKQKQSIPKLPTNANPLQKYRISQRILKNFPPFINLSQAYGSESSYIEKLRVYQKDKFSKSWQFYEQKLKKQLQKQAGKKWVKKSQSVWISQENREIELGEYIEKHVEKIFEREYGRYKEADKRLQSASIILRQKIHQFTLQYYRATLQLSSSPV